MANFIKLSVPKRVVIKLGTQVVMNDDKGPALDRLRAIIGQCATLHSQNCDVVLVTSGAVGLGLKELGLKRPLTLPEKQACAAVGQGLLMNIYRELFKEHSIVIGQLLLTASDFSNRDHYLRMQDAFETLLKLRAVPIINENDPISTMELEEADQAKSFGDNDKLSALISGKLGADLLVILTNVDGIYTDNPFENPKAELIAGVENLEALGAIRQSGQSDLGRGGIASKIEAARIAAVSGVTTVIASGLRGSTISDLFGDNQTPRTVVSARAPIHSRKQWLGHASGFEGVIVVNDGAKGALIEQGASLLAAGICSVNGEFERRDVISIQDEARNEIGRGLSNYSSQEINKIKGVHSNKISELLGKDGGALPGEVVHRDNLVIFSQIYK